MFYTHAHTYMLCLPLFAERGLIGVCPNLEVGEELAETVAHGVLHTCMYVHVVSLFAERDLIGVCPTLEVHVMEKNYIVADGT